MAITLDSPELDKPEKQSRKQLNKKQSASFAYYIYLLLGIVVISGATYLAYAPVSAGISNLPAYANLSWAHNVELVESLLKMAGMFWLVASALFWGGWLFRRSFRKIRGGQWRVHVDGKGKVAEFFPPVLSYLKVSCFYLAFILLFVIAQYPLQYLIFTR